MVSLLSENKGWVERLLETLYPTKFPNWKTIGVALLALGLAFFYSGCGGSGAATNANAANTDLRSKSVNTKVVAATTRQVPKYIEATGTFEAFETSDVAGETSGKVAQTLVKEGDFVNAGDVLVRLDERDAKLRLQQSRADENKARAQLSQAEAQFKQSQASLGLDKGGSFSIDNIPAVLQSRATLASRLSDLKLATTTERRYGNLLETGDTSKLIYDQKQNETEKAQAAVNEARENLKAAENTARQGNQGIAASQANVRNSQAALENAIAATAIAAKTTNDTTIRAPFAGYISTRDTAAGEYVSPTSKIATIVRTDPIKVRLQIPEKEIANIATGMSVSASVAAFTDRNFAGQVTAFNPIVNADSRNLLVEATFENNGNQLRPGMFATARVLLSGGDMGVYVLKSAVITETKTNSSGVYVIDENGTAKLRTVQIDESTRDQEEIRILSGIGENDRTATTNTEQLFDGVKVIAE